MKLVNVCGARPNYMKIAALMRAYARHPHIEAVLIHTGQHYDPAMNQVFFDELELPRPQTNLGVGSGPHGQQTAAVMRRFETVLLAERPDAVVVVGDVNSTLACALTARHLGIPTAHVEAGLRSFDRNMPEEINRTLTDAISAVLLVSEPSGVENLHREGVDPAAVHLVGNVMIDTLLEHLPRARTSTVHRRLGLVAGHYGLVTVHRPANVDDPDVFREIGDALLHIQRQRPLVFCMHPRTRRRADPQRTLRDLQACQNIRLIEPLGYREFLHLMADAEVILTDSGGIQEEATILGVPCLTLRDNTERPITVTHGTNLLAGRRRESILEAHERVEEIRRRPERTPPLWDGQAAERIATVLCDAFC